MGRATKLSLTLNVLLLLLLGALVWIFGVRGSIAPSADGRTAVLVTEGERDIVLAEMRAMLEATQTIVAAIATNDGAAIAAASYAVGMASTGDAPMALMAKLPLEFKMLGLATHRRFDDLAAIAGDSGDLNAATGALGDLMLNCTSCHASYRFATEATAD